MKKNLITSAIFLALPLAATANENTAQLDEVKVYSAYAAPVNQDKTASSVTVLTEKDFAQRNATYVSDVLKTVPGIAVASSGGRGALTSLFLRGANSNQTAVIIDGVKVNPLDSNFDFGGLSLSNVDRIEVLRGEQSALYGSDAIGGVIYITTKSGLYKDKAFNIDFDFGAGSRSTTDGSVTLSGHDNGFYYALHGSSHNTRNISAFSSNTFRYTAANGTPFVMGSAKEKDKFHSDKASLKVGFDDSNKGVELVASHRSQTVNTDNEKYDANWKRMEEDYDEIGYNTRSRETLFRLSGYLGNDNDLIKQKFAVSHVKTDVDNRGSVSASDGKKFNANYQIDVNFDREGAVTQAFSVLGDYQHSEYASSNFSAIKRKKLIEKAVAAEYRLFHEDDHSFAVSGRYVDNNQIKNKFVGRASVGFRILPNFRLHGSYGTALRTPTMIDYFGYYGSYLPNPDLKPEQSKGGDVGLLIESSDKRHSFDVTYFARNVSDLITTNSTYTQSVNEKGVSQMRGFEVAYNGKFTDSLTGFANYTFTRAKNNGGLELARRAKHHANAGIHFQATEKFGTQASLSYVGKRIDTHPYSTKLPSYTLVNLGADYQLVPNLKLYANLNNVFDKKYENILGYGQYGRNVYVGLKGSF